MQTFRRSAILAILILSLGAVACGANDVITALDLSIDAAAIALPLVGPSAGLPLELQAKLQAAFDTALADGAQATDILASSDTDAGKYASLVALYSNVSIPLVPEKYAGIAQAAQRVADLISKFLLKLPASNGAAPIAAARTSFLPPAGKSTRTKLSDAQRRKLAAMKAKASAARQAAKK